MPRSVTRVLVVYKKSAYQLHVRERKDLHLRSALQRQDPDALDLRVAHAVHERTLEAVIKSIKAAGIPYHLVYRSDLRRTTAYDLIVSVGGDGTLLHVAHAVDDTPILGVNSDPRRSEAVFSAATRTTFPKLLRLALARQLPALTLFRLRVGLNGRPLDSLVLNDVLIAHEDPATMSRYRLRIGRRQEFQKTSGLWIATAAGSSSAILAAGGTRLPWNDRRFQYRPRELYRGRLTKCQLTGGVLPMRAELELVWLMREGFVFMDGPHVRQPLRFGDRVVIGLSPAHPLRILGLQHSRIAGP